ncbi:TRIC cation channel family protein [Collinsella sp. zg1085]|nr:TRIC cation channel family protein [Collinsella sp. zg1085]
MSALVQIPIRMDAPVSVPVPLELLAVAFASASGMLSARKDKLDFIGALGIAIVCGLGGGVLRDVILQRGDVYILDQPLALHVSIATAALVFVFPILVEKPDRLLAFFDIFAVGLYAAMGADKALRYELTVPAALMMGFFTAVGGGMLRDIILSRVPYIFQRGNFYAIAALAGTGVYVFMVTVWHTPKVLALIACTVLTMVLRWVSLKYNILSPTEVNFSQMARPLRRFKTRTTETVLRQIQSTKGEHALDERHERVVAEIEARRSQVTHLEQAQHRSHRGRKHNRS